MGRCAKGTRVAIASAIMIRLTVSAPRLATRIHLFSSLQDRPISSATSRAGKDSAGAEHRAHTMALKATTCGACDHYTPILLKTTICPHDVRVILFDIINL